MDDTLNQEIDALSRRLQQLAGNADSDSTETRPLLLLALDELNSCIEELRVAQEEMHVQNEHIMASHIALQAEQGRYRDLFESAPDAYFVTDLLGVIRQANRRAATLLGRAPRYLIGKPLAQFVPLPARRMLRDLLEDGAKRVTEDEFELSFTPRTGRQPIATAVTLAVQYGRDRVPESLRWLIRESGPRAGAEAERYRLLVEEVRDYAIILMDLDGTIVNWNSGAENIFGWSAKEAHGLSGELIYPPEDKAAFVREITQAERTGRAQDERWHLRKDGSRFWGSGVMTALRSKDGVLRWYAKVLRDLTDSKQAQERLSADFLHVSRVAATFQCALLPELAEEFAPGLHLAALYEAAWREAQVGGDFYDVFPLRDRRIALAIGDVSGKGLAAAIRMSEIKTVLRSFLRADLDPASALAGLSDHLADSLRLDGRTENVFAALSVVVYDPQTGDAQATTAGLDPPLVLRADGSAEPIPARGLLLGIKDGTRYDTAAFRLEPGDTLLMATDGLTEARRGREFLDFEGLTALALRARRQPTLTAQCAEILESVRDYAGGRLQDDACLLLARRPETADAPASDG